MSATYVSQGPLALCAHYLTLKNSITVAVRQGTPWGQVSIITSAPGTQQNPATEGWWTYYSESHSRKPKGTWILVPFSLSAFLLSFLRRIKHKAPQHTRHREVASVVLTCICFDDFHFGKLKESSPVLHYKKPQRDKNLTYSQKLRCTVRFLPFELFTSLCLLHWGREELTEEENCHPTTQEFLGQRQVTPASPTFSPTTTRRKEKFILKFTLTPRKTTHSPVRCGWGTSGRRDSKKAVNQDRREKANRANSKHKSEKRTGNRPCRELHMLVATRVPEKVKSTRHESVLSTKCSCF